MFIKFSPQRGDDSLELELTGPDRIRVNGELFNFGPIEEGDHIEHGIVPSKWIVGKVSRINGEVDLTIILPHGINPPPHVAFPDPIHVSEPGRIALPTEEFNDVDT